MSGIWEHLQREPSRRPVYRVRAVLAVVGLIVGVVFLYLDDHRVAIISLMLMITAGLCQSVAELLSAGKTRLAALLRLASLPLMSSSLILLTVAVSSTLHSGHAVLPFARAAIIAMLASIAVFWLSRRLRLRE